MKRFVRFYLAFLSVFIIVFTTLLVYFTMREHDLDFDREFFGRYIAQRLSDRRKSLDITLVELAKRLGLKHPTITGILNGRALASISKY